jgi:hypothetical protein
MRYYRISEPALRELLMAAHNYAALEGGGVDNWEWYGESLSQYLDEYCEWNGINRARYDFDKLAEEDLAGYMEYKKEEKENESEN